MRKSTPSKTHALKKVVEQNPKMDLRNFHEWEQKNAELEAAGIDTKHPLETPQPKRQQPLPFGVLGL